MIRPDYRPCVGIMLINRAGLVFIGRRKNKRLVEHVAEGHEWQMPQGGIDEGEAPFDACMRGRYRGQRQKWFALRFEGDDAEIDIDARDGHKAEFDAWRWERMERLPDLIIPFKRPVYERVVAEFADFGAR